jgi:hypothetical protein
MNSTEDLVSQARSISEAERQGILRAIPEVELHRQLKALFGKMEPEYIVEVTHGTKEYGKDLVLVRTDKFETRVIGVVVKRGDIKGTSAGDVDDILQRIKLVSAKEMSHKEAEVVSQIEQAATIPAELKCKLNELKVDDVYVVIAGEIGLNAQKRLRAERPSHVQLYDLGWLVDNFTEFYPQVFFNGRAQDFIQLEIYKLQSSSFMQQKGKNLTEYYVEPTFMPCNMTLDLDPEQIAGLGELPNLPFQKLTEIMAQKGRILILGDPGSGKSAALAKLALDQLHEASAQLRKDVGKDVGIPVLVTAQELLKIGVTDDLIGIRVEDPTLAPTGLSVRCLLVDGLDELPRSERVPVLKKATDLATLNRCPVIVASRRLGDIQAVSSGTYTKYEILPFNPGEAMRLFKHLAPDDLLEPLSEGLQRINLQIPLFPLSLMLLIRVVQDRREVPASATELYTLFLESALGKYDRDKGIDVLFEYHVKGNFLAHLAYSEFFEKDRLAVPHEDFDTFLDAYATEYALNRERLASFLSEVERAGILNLGDEVEFRHRTFLDYFVARYMFDSRDEIQNVDDKIVELYYSTFWGDVAFFYIGLKTDLKDVLLDKLLEHETKQLSGLMDKMMIGRLLQAGWDSPASIKSRGLKGAVDAAEPLRQILLGIPKDRNRLIPEIYTDFIMLFLADTSFSSRFLQQQLSEQFAAEISRDTAEALPRAILILWAEQRLLTFDEIHLAIESCTKLLRGGPSLPAKEEARCLLLLRFIGRRDRELDQVIRKKLTKLKKAYPDVFRKLLPPQRSRRALHK